MAKSHSNHNPTGNRKTKRAKRNLGNKFGLVHLSDLHFGQHPGWINPLSTEGYNSTDKLISLYATFFEGKIPPYYPTSHSPEAAVGLLTTIFRSDFLDTYPVNAFVVTGDLSTTGNQADLQRAADFFERGSVYGIHDSDYEVNNLSALHNIAPIALLPGNHDRFKSQPTYFPNAQEFENVFGENWDTLGNIKQRLYQACKGRVKAFVLYDEKETLIIVSIDCSLKSVGETYRKSGRWLGLGKVDDEILEEAEEVTVKFRDHINRMGYHTAVIWAMHYCPYNDDDLKLIDKKRLFCLAARLNVQFVLTGHSHTLYNKAWGRIPVVNCGSTFSQCQAPNQFSFSYLNLSVSNGRIIDFEMHPFKFNPTLGVFTPTRL